MFVQRKALRTVLGFKLGRFANPYPKLCSQLTVDSNARRRLHASSLRSVATAVSAMPESYPTSHERILSPGKTQNFLDNKFIDSKATSWIDLHDPATNNLVTRVPQSTVEELNSAVASAQKAFAPWKATSLLYRQQIMFKFVALIRQNWDRLAASITLEQGKTFADAKGDVLRGLQVAETACGITTQLTGEVLEVAKDMETRNYREPLGVVAAICPFSGSCQMMSRYSEANLVYSYRLPSYDPLMVYSNRDDHWKYAHLETVRTRSWSSNDISGIGL